MKIEGLVKIREHSDVIHSILKIGDQLGVSILEFKDGCREKYNLALIVLEKDQRGYEIVDDNFLKTNDKKEVEKAVYKLRESNEKILINKFK